MFVTRIREERELKYRERETKYDKKGICKAIIKEGEAEENKTLERKVEDMSIERFCYIPTESNHNNVKM